MIPKLFTTIQSYSAKLFVADIIAGVTVAMVALPLSIAIAIASGTQPAAGLVTAVIGGLVVSTLGGSRVQIGGPTGAFIVVIYGVIQQFGFSGLLLATLMAGIVLVVGSLLRAGRLIAVIPEPVIEGFTIGIAVIIVVSQLKDLFGETIPRMPAEIVEIVPALWAARGSVNLAALAIGTVTIVLIMILRWAAPRIPGSIIAIAVASAAVALLALPVETLQSRFGSLPDGLPMIALPPISSNLLVALLPSAFLIAFLAAVESLLSAVVADRMILGAHRSNAELLAQGAANIASPLFGGLPVTGAIARTATNVRAGGRTPVAGIVHALTILLVMVAAAPLAAYLTLPALAGLLIVTAWVMSEPQRWPERLQASPGDQVVFFLTFGLTVLSSLIVAIAIGTMVGLAQRQLRRAAPPPDKSERRS
jgi:sulfate permease, SulP family